MGSLIWACERGDITRVRALLDGGVDPNAKDSLSRRGLPAAARGGHLRVVQLLLERGADVALADEGRLISIPSLPALAAAASAGRLQVVRALLAARAPLDQRSSYGRTALILAIEGDHDAVVEALIDAGADLELADELMERTPLETAAYHKRSAALQRLLRAGADPNHGNPLSTLCASVMGATHEHDVRALLDAGAVLDAPGERGRTPLLSAARWHGVAPVRALLDAGADVRAAAEDGETCLHAAAQSREADFVIPLLLAAGADPRVADAKGQTPLLLAARCEHASAASLRALLDAGADVNARARAGEQALHAVYSMLRRGDARVPAKTALLLERGAEVDVETLHRAARHGDAQAVFRMLERGAPLDAQDTYSRSALYWACHDGVLDVVLVLLLAGAALDARDKDGNTPLHAALKRRELEVAGALLMAGAALLRNDAGHTPLHYVDDEARRDELMAVRDDLAGAFAALKPDARPGLRCAVRTGDRARCDGCGWRAGEERALCCPWCSRRALTISDYEVLHGNPHTPASDTEVRFTYTCEHCGLAYANGWNAFNSSAPWVYEVEAGGSWSSEDGGETWRRVWGLSE
ncbi:MAG: ankyrin repeat domain-containing protein [Myxococcales bacterium]|nr:ankyrin repeat domain-containing protein [Myxococcales bacterium]